MEIEVLCFGALREFLPAGADGHRAVVGVASGATVGDIVDALGVPRRLVVSALVGDERSGLDRVLREGERVTLMPPFTGG